MPRARQAHRCAVQLQPQQDRALSLLVVRQALRIRSLARLLDDPEVKRYPNLMWLVEERLEKLHSEVEEEVQVVETPQTTSELTNRQERLQHVRITRGYK